MNKKYFLSLAIAAIALISNVQAQINYNFDPYPSPWTTLSGVPAPPVGGNDDGFVASVPIGFNFYYDYGPIAYTTVGVSTNGFAVLNTPLGTSQPNNNIGLDNGLVGNRPLLAPYWDDLIMNGNITYLTTGTAPNRVFTMQWDNVTLNYVPSPSSSGADYPASFSMQMELHENSRYVRFHYGNVTPAGASYSGGSFSSSIGITETGTGNNNYMSLTSAGGAPTFSKTSSTNNIGGVPLNGQTYEFWICPDPTNLISSGITTNFATVSWACVNPVTEWVWDQNPADPTVPGIPTTNTSQSFSNLIPNTDYYFHVRNACDHGHYSNWVTIQIHTNSLPPCLPPNPVIAFNMGYFDAQLMWQPVAGALGYQYKLNQNPATPTGQGTYTSLNYFNPTGLQPLTTYYYHIRTICSAFAGDTSQWVTVSFTTLPLPLCLTPTGISAYNRTNNSADVTWDNYGGVIGWEYVIDQTPTTPVVGNFSLTNVINVVNLASLTTYYVHVKTDCSTWPGDTSGWAIYAFKTLPDSCTKPDGLQITFTSQFTALCSWNSSPGAYAYEYIVDENPGNPSGNGTPTFTTYHSVGDLASSTQYYLHVRTICDSAFYYESATDWVTSTFTTLPGVNVPVIAGGDDFNISAFPNPVQNMMTVNIKGIQKGNASLLLTDITGRTIQSIKVGGKDKLDVDMSGLATGMYMLKYTDDGQSYTVRITKQ